MFRAVMLCAVLLGVAGPSLACIVGDLGQPPQVVITAHPPDLCGGPSFVGSIQGTAANVNTDSVVVVLYAETDRLYIQPWGGSQTEISCSTPGSFQNATRGGHHYVAILARRSWSPPNIMCSVPAVGGDIVAVARAPERTVSFAGLMWEVKSSEACRIDPGPNYWSDSTSNVWVDGLGQLHLKITHRQVGQEVRWFCPEVYTREIYGYGQYWFQLGSPAQEFDPNVVTGLFAYYCDPACTPTICGHSEIDVELSRWGVAGGPNLQYAVQPFGSCLQERHAMGCPGDESLHRFWWTRNAIDFRSWCGNSPLGSLIAARLYADTTCIPIPRGENARLNLWLYNGASPSDGQDVELIVKDFRFEPPPPAGVDDQGDLPPGGNLLGPNIPNPLRSTTRIAFRVPQPGMVSLQIYDLAGAVVRNLANRHMDAGQYRLSWDGATDRGARAAPGLYFYELRVGGRRETRKAILLE